MKFSTYLFILTIAATTITAQTKKFTTEDIVINSKTFLKPQKPDNFKWVTREKSYSDVEDNGEDFVLIKGSISTGRKLNVLTLEQLNFDLDEYEVGNLSDFPDIEWMTEYEFRFDYSGKTFKYHYELENLDIIYESPIGAGEFTYSSDNEHRAYVLNNDLYYQPLDDDPVRITSNGSENITNGKPVSRNEFGIDKGIFWAPNNQLLAFYSEDLSEVDDYPLIDISTSPASVKKLKYPMAGRNSSKVKIGIYNIEEETTIYLNTSGSFDDYLTSVTWAPDSRLIYVAHLNRDQNHLKLIRYNASTGEPIMTMLEEQNDKYIEPEHGLIFLPSDPDQFIWFSEKDGWNHMYLYDSFGRLTLKLTEGNWVVKDFLGFDKNSENVFITGTSEDVLEDQLYKVSLRDENMEKLTLEKGTHKIIKHPDFDIFLDKYSSLENPGTTKIIDNGGRTITTIKRSQDPYLGYARGRVELLSIKGKNNFDLYCRMFYPADFKKFQKYPAIVYVYGGPHKQLVTDSFPEGKYDIWAYRMAQEGYFVFMLDNRGTDNRGLAFEQEIFGQLGTAELEDQLAGVEYLKSLSFIDENRLGVYGWSYGGFMSISLMTKASDIFKVGVAGGPVIDWSMYEVMYTERYMNTPQDNPTGYSNSNLLNHVGNLSGKLLLVHGMNDSTVVPEHSLRFVKAAVDRNKPIDYFQYPGYGHHVKGVDAIHLYDKIIDYFLKNL